MEGPLDSEVKVCMDHQNSRKIDEHEVISMSLEESQCTESKSTQWTDEKHSLYLKSMETSFVNKMYGSSDLFGRYSKNKCSSKLKSSRHGQYKVFRDGCWTKIDLTEDVPKLKRSANGSGGLLAVARNKCPASEVNLCNQNPVGNITEAMDQNFVNDDRECEKSSRKHNIKRTQNSLVADSSNDQVVPCSMTNDLSDNRVVCKQRQRRI